MMMDENPFELVTAANGLVIYGTGAAGQEVHAVFSSQAIEVKGFVDDNTRKKEFCGLSVWAGSEVPAEISRNTTVIIAIFNPHVDVCEIVSRIQNAGWSKVITFLEILHRFPTRFAARWWADPSYSYEAKTEEVETARRLLADTLSRELFDQVLQFRKSGDVRLAPLPTKQTQYFPEDLPQWKSPIRFVDCGAFDGDTIRSTMDNNIELEAVALFEPDAANFVKIQQTLVDLVPNKIPHVYCWPCGVFSKTTQLSFSSGAGTGSGISEEGNCVIQCVSLDEALVGFSPTLVKMDIEGAEIEALLGAKKIIRNGRPGLAICVYHTPGHMWEIPLLLESWKLNYKFFLRCHAYSTFDLVLYAFPV
ncbi:MAG: methyltransferase [Verrucomicrobiales bacterium]|nr:methyltransferase [Verrucomicrobiales bacterium]